MNFDIKINTETVFNRIFSAFLCPVILVLILPIYLFLIIITPFYILLSKEPFKKEESKP